MSEATYWNGERCVAVQGTGVIQREITAVASWPSRRPGEIAPVVRVTYGGESFYLDDHEGRGWAKVTTGHGSPRYGHRNLSPAKFHPAK